MKELIQKNFGLESFQGAEEDFREWLENRISYMLDHETDLLMSTLYRLDVDEAKIKWVLEHVDPPLIVTGLTELVLERQRQRQLTKKAHRKPKDDFYWGEL